MERAENREAEGRRSRILVVDDDERNLVAVREVLEPVGEVVCARSGDEALRHLLRDEFAVILLDVLMPGLDGYETAALIRQREKSKRTPIIFLSAIGKDDAHMLKGYDAGAVDYVFKPFDTLILKSKVAVFVDLHEKTIEIREQAARERQLEEQLAQARKMETVGQLTGGIAHDFNNLIASVLSGLSLLERRVPMPAEAKPILDMTRHAARQGADLIDRMLAFSRRRQLSPARVVLPEMARSLDGLLAPVLGGLVKLQWRVPEEAWPIHADRGQLELATMNLVINARDAMPQGGTITLAAENAALAEAEGDLAAGDYVVLSVQDTGTGIAPELLAKVVEPFFTTKGVGKGTGLGLSTAYGFARQSGGTLRIESEVGRGTRVALWLPRSSEEAPAEAAGRQARAARPPRLRGAPEILLVDDSGSLRELTAAMLREHGYSVCTAAGGAEALALIEKEPDRFALIVTDFAMPLVSGLDVVRFARSHRPDWPAILISGYADATAIRDRPEDVPLLGKPFPDEVLLGAIDERLGVGIEPRRKAAVRG